MKKVRLLYKLFVFFLIIGFVGICSLYAYAYFSPEITLNSANSLSIYDNNNTLVMQASNNSRWVGFNDISKDLINATISVEDKNFYNHFGFDYLRIIKSLYLNIKNKEITAGASTISQQYVKNLYLDFDQTWKRKIDEAMLTLNLETHYTKDEILEGYLNTINYGQGNFGIQNASNYYFNKDCDELTLEEALILAGIPKSPENYNPISNYDKSIERAKVVAKSMVNNKLLTEDKYNSLFKENIEIYGKKETNNMLTFMYYYDAMLEELNSINTLSKDLLDYGGLKIYTNFDLNTQMVLDKTISDNNTNENMQIASIMIEPSTGKILALVGGVNYAKSQFNRITQSNRQVGSTIKPFLYYTALQNNMTMASTFKSEQTNFVFANEQEYKPNNYSNIYGNKEITMAAALAYSDNVYAVKTHLFLGEENLVNTLKIAGLKKQLEPNPSLALGAYEMNLLDYANAYTTLANYGTYNKAYIIRKIEDINGNILYEYEQESESVLNKDDVYIVNEMMSNTYNPIFTDYVTPTILSLNSRITKKYALKSGTTDNDYLLVGYNPDIFMMVWAGNDLNEENDSTYSTKIKDIWVTNIENYLKDREEVWYEPSNNIIAIPLDAISGEYNPNSKNNTLFYFKKGSEPIFNN